jgi:hypothetical protein
MTENPMPIDPEAEYHGDKLLDNYNYNPVNINDTVATLVLGVLVILLYIALRRAQGRYEALLEQTRSA